ncbi:MAG: VOC family protein [Tepidiformaceae bacterium]
MLDPTKRPAIQLLSINMDCRDPQEMADFYGELLGWGVKWRDHDFIVLGNPTGGPNVSFQEYPDYQPPVWPEQPGEQWKMVHFDMKVDDLEAAVAWAIACGARLAAFQGRDDIRVMLDPAGHPFCLCLE